jgi:thioester reductase-like protein
VSVFITGATGFIGERLLARLLEREGEVHALAREQSVGRLEALAASLAAGDRVKPVVGDLGAPLLGIDQAWIDAHAGSLNHVFHLAAIYDMTASEQANDRANVGGTREAVKVANALRAGCLHQVSSVAAAGGYVGRFTEDMFDEGQPLEHAYHRTKFESERIAREESTVPWRVYRPAIVVGDSKTGEMDKIDGPYYFFPLLDGASKLPSPLRFLAPRLGTTNMVPVDYVADAIDHIAHKPGLDGLAFHLVNPEPQSTVDVLNVFARIAGAPQLVGALPRLAIDLPLKAAPVRALLDQLGIPAAAVDHASFTCTFDDSRARAALAGSGIAVPPLEGYAPVLWRYWKEHLR